MKNENRSQLEQTKKSIQKTFKEHGLDIIIQGNMKIVNNLFVTFNLNDGTYKPYTKPNNEIKYIHRDPKRPPDVIRQISLSLESRLSTVPYNEKFFKNQYPFFKKHCKTLTKNAP